MNGPRAPHRVYLIPGLFGFTTLAGYNYFFHLEGAIRERFDKAGVPLEIFQVPSLPTSSLVLRAAEVARTVSRTARRDDGPVHFIGHSSGGLDARLLLSPSRTASFGADELDWSSRVRTLCSMNTPHYGTPLAAYFSTISGTRFLYALSLLTVATLSIGRVPLGALAGAISAVRAIDGGLGLDLRLVDELTEGVLRFVGERGRKEIGDFLTNIKKDQAGIVQLMPEVASLFNAAAEDNSRVRYGCVVAAAPPPAPRRLFRAALSPFRAVQLALYTTVYGVASRDDSRYPYAIPTPEQARALRAGLGRDPRPDFVDGIIPTLSMVWGEVIWAGAADHLDIVGHFEDDVLPTTHVDWLHSGANFSRRDFTSMTDALCAFMLRE